MSSVAEFESCAEENGNDLNKLSLPFYVYDECPYEGCGSAQDNDFYKPAQTAITLYSEPQTDSTTTLVVQKGELLAHIKNVVVTIEPYTCLPPTSDEEIFNEEIATQQALTQARNNDENIYIINELTGGINQIWYRQKTYNLSGSDSKNWLKCKGDLKQEWWLLFKNKNNEKGWARFSVSTEEDLSNFISEN